MDRHDRLNAGPEQRRRPHRVERAVAGVEPVGHVGRPHARRRFRRLAAAGGPVPDLPGRLGHRGGLHGLFHGDARHHRRLRHLL